MASETAALVGERLRAAREERGWTRRRLVSEMDGIAVENDIYRWETGKHRPRDDALAAAARALGKPLAYFLEPEPSATPEPFASTAADLERRLARIEAQLDELLGRRPPADLDEQTAEEALNYLKRATQVMQNTLGRLGRDVGRQDLQASPAADRSRSRGQAAA